MNSKFLAAIAFVPLMGCAANATDQGQPTALSVGKPKVTGTVFTIVFENEAASDVLTPANPYFYALLQKYGTPSGYGTSVHPSLPNYIAMTSGATEGITTDNDPAENIRIVGTANVPAQLDSAKIMWRAYIESMGTPCKMASDNGLYSAHHNPFLYYDYVVSGQCAQHVVDFDQNFAADLTSGLYKYMWITPNMCDDMHNCESSVSDQWLAKVLPQILASQAYLQGGAVFILFDEGASRAPGAFAILPTIVISPNLAGGIVTSKTSFDHSSYVATVEDIFGLGRLPTTEGVTSMDELFQTAPVVP